MKPLFALPLVLVATTIALATWQHRTLTGLRQTEARLNSGRGSTEAGSPAPGPADGSETPPAPPPQVTDQELPAFIAEALTVKSEFESDRWFKISDKGDFSHPALCETLRRLSSAQLRAVLEAWQGGEAFAGDMATGLHRFMLLAGKVNPSATVPLMYELRAQRGEKAVPGAPSEAWRQWFRQDPDGLLQWARSAGLPEGFGDSCGLWTDAVLTARDPSEEHVRQLLAHGSDGDNWTHNEVVLKLPTQQARLTFFRSLHDATGGVTDDLVTYVWQLAQRLPFAQLAQIADETPTIKPAQPEEFAGRVGDDPLGSLRWEIAIHSRDSTAEQRWAWLTQHEEDRPSGKTLQWLAKKWSEDDYASTAAWVRSLPPGPERDTATQGLITSLKWNGAPERAREWEKK